MPLLRDAGRLDILEIKPRPVPCPGAGTPAPVLRHALGRHASRHRDAARARLVEDWLRLSRASREAATLTALLRLMASAVSSESRGPLLAPRFGHGRDMRPWLADREVLRGWLCELHHLWQEAIAPLLRERLLPGWMVEHGPAPDGSWCPDVFVAVKCGARLDMRAAAFDARFALRVLPFAPACDGVEILRRMEAAYLALPVSLQEDGAVAVLASRGAAGLGWLELMAHDTPERAHALMCALMAAGADTLPPSPRGTQALLATLSHMRTRWSAPALLRWAFEGLARGADPRWMAGALRVAVRLGDENPPEVIKTSLRPSAAKLFAFQARWRAGAWVTRGLWQAASRHAGMHELLRDIVSSGLNRTTVMRLARWLIRFGAAGDGNGCAMTVRWQLLRTHWREMLGCLRKAAGAHREDLLQLFQAGLQSAWTEAHPDLGPDAMHWAHVLEEAQTADPSCRIGVLTHLLPRLASRERLRVARHLPELMSAVKKLSRSHSFEENLVSGLACIPRLGRRACVFLLLREPRAFLKGLASLGELSLEAGDRVVRTLREHPLVSCRAEACGLKELAVMTESASYGRPHGQQLAERVRQHLSGEKPQPPHLVEADRAELLNVWARLAVDVLNELIQRELHVMFPRLRHAGVPGRTLMFLHTLEDHRRRGRALVRRLLQGVPGTKQHHPANLRWLREQLGPGATLWTHGLHWTEEVAGVGIVTLKFEQDALEVLHMGDHAGSCLGSGGWHQYAALTNALEVNKQVLHARNARGRIIGRQLLAISEERKLVCFSVYPHDAGAALKEVFARHDCALAEALGLPIELGETYTVAAPLGLKWYDDGAWRHEIMTKPRRGWQCLM